MMPIGFSLPDNCPPRLVVLGAHSDDVEIGAGATVLALGGTYPAAKITWVVFAASGRREKEARASAAQFTEHFAEADIRIHAFPDGRFPSVTGEIKDVFESLKETTPDLVLTHYRDDRHQDHRSISELTWQTFRNHCILEYEIPKYDGDLGRPNLFVPVDELRREAKLSALRTHFASQHGKGWFTDDTFNGLMRLRGIECQSPTGYAEAFYARKMVLSAGDEK